VSKTLITKIKRSIAFISDLHIGSRYAICPDKFKTSEGVWLIPSHGQATLNDGFKAFIKKCNEMKVDTVVVNGDTLDGQNIAENGMGLSTSNLDEQVDMAIEVLRPILNGKKLLMLSGSGYHKSVRGMNPEKAVCDDLGQYCQSSTWLGPVANIRFSPSKKVFNIHHGYTGSVIYREMVLAREGLFTKWAEGSGKLPRIDVVVRGHLHNFIYIHENDLHLLQLPCWKAFEPSKITLKLYAKMQPDIGGCIVLIDNNDRMVVHHYLYSCPAIVGEVREE